MIIHGYKRLVERTHSDVHLLISLCCVMACVQVSKKRKAATESSAAATESEAAATSTVASSSSCVASESTVDPTGKSLF